MNEKPYIRKSCIYPNLWCCSLCNKLDVLGYGATPTLAYQGWLERRKILYSS